MSSSSSYTGSSSASGLRSFSRSRSRSFSSSSVSCSNSFRSHSPVLTEKSRSSSSIFRPSPAYDNCISSLSAKRASDFRLLWTAPQRLADSHTMEVGLGLETPLYLPMISLFLWGPCRVPHIVFASMLKSQSLASNPESIRHGGSVQISNAFYLSRRQLLDGFLFQDYKDDTIFLVSSLLAVTISNNNVPSSFKPLSFKDALKIGHFIPLKQRVNHGPIFIVEKFEDTSQIEVMDPDFRLMH